MNVMSNSFYKYRSSSAEAGISLIESIVCLSVIVFLSWGGFVSYAYISTIQQIQQISNDAVSQIHRSTKFLHTGDQGYFLKTSNGCTGSDANSSLIPLNEVADTIESAIKSFFNCTKNTSSCPEYYIETRYVAVSVNPTWGSLNNKNGHPLLFKKCLNNPNKGYLAVREKTPQSIGTGDTRLLTYIKSELTEEAKSPLAISQFAIPAGLFDVQQKQVYGSSEARFVDSDLSGTKALETKMQFLRSSPVMGVWIEVDLSGTVAGKALSLSTIMPFKKRSGENSFEGEDSTAKASKQYHLISKRLFLPRATL